MKNEGCPCNGCKRRSIGCHGKCREHADWKNKKDSENARLRFLKNCNTDYFAVRGGRLC